ncbi:maltose/moltooligosaccharide transporter [Flavobacterium sp. 103]|uniref:MFS transporter n=1 Tax=unclassified Flavobacterium TaxID=196869 RepID=UPI000D5CB114|nr:MULTISPECIES: MFS transporter [unclassified Flavobacterium]PVX46252.1 maltose/moltooligosaccharide transporter [Flavobacterium sp. 103]QKJ61633.1 MFS transporter [Flavobacterium sp. M31R6]
MEKPKLSFWQIWNLSFGFLGVQIGYSLQNGNTSRILEALGADVHSIGYFWLAAPLAGLVVQPIIGLSSDKTWTKLGRRIPFIFFGAIVSAMAMFFMPNAEYFTYLLPPLVFGAVMLLLMDTSFNVTMQPFRALVGDMVNDEQRNLGYSLQSALINFGAVFGSLLPWILVKIGMSNVPAAGEKVAESVIWSFYIGGTILLGTVLWTVLRTKEYAPKEHAEYNKIDLNAPEKKEKTSIFTLIGNAPKIFWQLGIVQFFSWFALFLMWVYTTRAIANQVWGHGVALDAKSIGFNEAGDWTGVMFAFYSGVAAVFSLLIPSIAKSIGRKKTYSFSLVLGGLGLISMFLVEDKNMLLLSISGVGLAWAAILAMPYAMLSGSLPADKMGVYMGLFNATITIPQIAAGILGSTLIALFGGNPMAIIVIAGVSMLIAGSAVFFVKEKVQL